MSVGKRFEVMEVPRDDEGFVVSFRPDQVDEYKQFFDAFGFVVIGGALSQEQCDNTVQDIWLELENVRVRDNPDRNDPRTWDRWPGLRSLGLFRQALTHFSWRNRLEPHVRECFRNVLGKRELWVSVDNFGVMRPTRAIPLGPLPYTPTRISVEQKTFADDEGDDSDDEGHENEKEKNEKKAYVVEDRLEWETKPKWLHWDLNPFAWCKGEGTLYRFDNFITENNGSRPIEGNVKVQGLLNLIDSRPQDGGFLTVPGFCHHLRQWVQQEHLRNYELGVDGTYDFVNVPQDDPMQHQVERIAMRAGSLLIWNSEQPHCNYSNSSDRFRMVQYVKCFEAPTEETASCYHAGVAERRKQLKYAMSKGLSREDIQALTEDDRHLLGLADY